MTLYFYDQGSRQVLAQVEAAAYTDTQVIGADGCIYSPLAEHVELSSKADCSETLRADWAAAHPSQETRMNELEELMAALLYGGGEEA